MSKQDENSGIIDEMEGDTKSDRTSSAQPDKDLFQEKLEETPTIIPRSPARNGEAILALFLIIIVSVTFVSFRGRITGFFAGDKALETVERSYKPVKTLPSQLEPDKSYGLQFAVSKPANYEPRSAQISFTARRIQDGRGYSLQIVDTSQDKVICQLSPGEELEQASCDLSQRQILQIIQGTTSLELRVTSESGLETSPITGRVTGRNQTRDEEETGSSSESAADDKAGEDKTETKTEGDASQESGKEEASNTAAETESEQATGKEADEGADAKADERGTKNGEEEPSQGPDQELEGRTGEEGKDETETDLETTDQEQEPESPETEQAAGGETEQKTEEGIEQPEEDSQEEEATNASELDSEKEQIQQPDQQEAEENETTASEPEEDESNLTQTEPEVTPEDNLTEEETQQLEENLTEPQQPSNLTEPDNESETEDNLMEPETEPDNLTETDNETEVGDNLTETGNETEVGDNLTQPSNETGADNLTQPESETNVTEPENLTNVTQPDNITNVTRPENVTNITQPGNVTNITQPGNLTNVTNITQPENVTNVSEPVEVKFEISDLQLTVTYERTGRPEAPENVANVTEPENVTNVTQPENVTNVTRPEEPGPGPGPQPGPTPLPDNLTNVTNVTEPENVTNVTLPENITNVTNVTQPQNVTNITQPENITNLTNVTWPENWTNLTNFTQPGNLTNVTNITQPENVTNLTNISALSIDLAASRLQLRTNESVTFNITAEGNLTQVQQVTLAIANISRQVERKNKSWMVRWTPLEDNITSNQSVEVTATAWGVNQTVLARSSLEISLLQPEVKISKTQTEIDIDLEPDQALERGEMLTITGVLSAANNNLSTANRTLAFYHDGELIDSSYTDNNSKVIFYYNTSQEKLGEHSVNLTFSGSDNLSGASSSASYELKPSRRQTFLAINVSRRVIRGQLVNVTTHLTAVRKPLPNVTTNRTVSDRINLSNQTLALFLDSERYLTQPTDEAGAISTAINTSNLSVGSHILNVTFSGTSTFYLSANSSQFVLKEVKPFNRTKIELEMPEVMVKGLNRSVEARLLVGGAEEGNLTTPVSNQPLHVQLDAEPYHSWKTNQQGTISFRPANNMFLGDHNLSVSYHGNESLRYAPSNTTGTFELRPQWANITLHLPPEIRTGKRTVVKARLSTQLGGLSNYSLQFSFNHSNRTYPRQTDARGFVAFNWTPYYTENYTLHISLQDDLRNSSIVPPSTISREIEVLPGLVQSKAEVGRSVRWHRVIRKRNLDEEDKKVNISFYVPAEAKNVTVKERLAPVGAQVAEVGDETDSAISTASLTSTSFKTLSASSVAVKDVARSVELKVSKVDSETKEAADLKQVDFDVDLAAGRSKEFTTEFVTPPPVKREEVKRGSRRIEVSSNISYHYFNVTAFTSIPDLKEKPNFHRLVKTETVATTGNSTNSTNNQTTYNWVNVTGNPLYNVTYFDRNNNSLFDTIKWNVPRLSTDTYAVNLTIINPQSYPMVGDNWTVRFNTTRSANLSITPAINTTWSNNSENSSLYDLKFLQLRCGNNTVDYQWLNRSEGNSSLFVANYTCHQTAHETSKVLTEGIHNLKFEYGPDVAYANNSASTITDCPTGGNVTITEDCVVEEGNISYDYLTLNATMNITTSAHVSSREVTHNPTGSTSTSGSLCVGDSCTFYNNPPTMDAIVTNVTYVKETGGVKVTTVNASDPDNDDYTLRCGNTSWSTNLCNSTAGIGERSCSFNSPWADNSEHTIYCHLDDGSEDSQERNTSVIADNIPPKYYNRTEEPTSPTVYEPDKVYQFNITWQDSSSGVGEVVFQFNGTNYTSSGRVAEQGDEYYINLTDLPANEQGYSYRWYGRDAAYNWNATQELTYVINKSSTSTNLLLNGTDGNYTYNYTQTANFTVTVNISNRTVFLETNMTDWQTQNETTPLVNLTTMDELGVFNITGYFPGDQNYSQSSETHYATVQDVGPPSISYVPPTPANNSRQRDNFVTINATVYDNTGVDTCVLEWQGTNETIEPVNGYCNISKVTYDATTYVFEMWANDTAGNWKSAGRRTFRENEEPEHDRPVLNSSSGNNLTTDNLTVYPQNVTDADNDSVTNITNWQVDNQSLTVLNLPFDTNRTGDTSQGAIRDYTPYHNNGTLGNGNVSRAPVWVSGQVGGAYEFNGSTYISVPDSQSLSLSSESLTLEVWMRTSASSERVIFDKFTDGNWDGYWMGQGDSGGYRVCLASAGSQTCEESGSFPNDGQWHHLAFVYDQSSGNWSWYLDGNLAANVTNQVSFSDNEGTLRIGDGRWSTGNSWKGELDQVHIYNRTLTAAQIENNYQEGLAGHSIRTVVSDETTKGEIWQTAVTPNDQYEDGQTKLSNTLKINVTEPRVNLTSPLDDFVVNENITFEADISGDVELVNASLYWNYTGNWGVEETKSLSGTSATPEFDQIQVPEGTYKWNVRVCDSEAACGWGEKNFTVIVDTTNPNISYVEPTDNDTANLSRDWAYVNVSLTDEHNVSGFIDFNRSLRGYWSFDSYNDSGVYDNSTYDNFGDFKGGLSPENITHGPRGEALELDGTDDYVDIENDLASGWQELTAVAWFRTETPPSDKAAFIGQEDAVYFEMRSDGTVGGAIRGDSGIYSSSSYADGDWHQAVLTYQGGETYSVYVDGLQVASASSSASNIPSSGFEMAIGWRENSGYLPGTVDEVQIWDRALSVEEINASYYTSDNSTGHRLAHNFTSLADGNYSFYAYGIDEAGNTNRTENRSISVDTQAPQIAVHSPENKTYHTRELKLNLTTSEPAESCWWNLNGGNNTFINGSRSTNWTQNFTVEEDGSYHLYAYCNDSAGNVGVNDSIWFTVSTIDITLTKNIDPDAIIAGEEEPINVTTEMEITRASNNITTFNLTDEVPYDFSVPSLSRITVYNVEYAPYAITDVTDDVTVNITNYPGNNNTEIRINASDMAQTSVNDLEVNDTIRLVYNMTSSAMEAGEDRLVTTNASVKDVIGNGKQEAINKTITSARTVLRGEKDIWTPSRGNPQKFSVKLELKALGGPVTDILIADYMPEGAVVENRTVTYYNNSNQVTVPLYNQSDFFVGGGSDDTLPGKMPVDLYHYNFSYNFTHWDGYMYDNDSITINMNVSVLGGGAWKLPATLAGWDPTYKKHIKTEATSHANVPLFDVVIDLASDAVKPGEMIKAVIKLINKGGPQAQVDVFGDYAIKTLEGDMISGKSETFAVKSKKKREIKMAVPQDVKPGRYTFEALITYTGREAMSTEYFNVKGEGVSIIQKYSVHILLTIIIVILILTYVRVARILKHK